MCFSTDIFLFHVNNQERAWNVKNHRVIEINCNLKHSMEVKLQDCKKTPVNYGSLISSMFTDSNPLQNTDSYDYPKTNPQAGYRCDLHWSGAPVIKTLRY